MNHLLLVRAGFWDETAALRLHRRVGVQVRAFSGRLDEVVTAPALEGPSPPVGVVFCVPAAGRREESLVALPLLRMRCASMMLMAFLDGRTASVRDRSSAAVELFDAGVDDVVPVAVDPCEYGARLRAAARRRGWPWSSLAAASRQAGLPPRVDASRRLLLGPRGVQPLTAKECVVMSTLLEVEGVATRALIGERLWTDGWYGTGKAIDMHVANLRRKLHAVSGEEWRIEAVRGSGFVLVGAGAESGLGA